MQVEPSHIVYIYWLDLAGGTSCKYADIPPY